MHNRGYIQKPYKLSETFPDLPLVLSQAEARLAGIIGYAINTIPEGQA